jgi:hypothetical protein
MSRRSRLVIALLAVMAMMGGAAGGFYLGRLEEARKVAVVRPAPANPAPGRVIQPIPPGAGDPATAPPGARAAPPAGRPPAPATTAARPGPTTTTPPPVLTARIAARLPDGLLIGLDASQPLRGAVLRWGFGTRLTHANQIQGTVTHGTVKLPLDGNAPVTVQASGRAADGRTVTSNLVSGRPL